VSKNSEFRDALIEKVIEKFEIIKE